MTVTSAGISKFTSGINIGDSVAGVSVNFVDSGAITYANPFNVNLNDAGAGTISFDGTTALKDSHSLSASTAKNTIVNSGAATHAGIAISKGKISSAGGNVLVKGEPVAAMVGL